MRNKAVAWEAEKYSRREQAERIMRYASLMQEKKERKKKYV